MDSKDSNNNENSDTDRWIPNARTPNEEIFIDMNVTDDEKIEAVEYFKQLLPLLEAPGVVKIPATYVSSPNLHGFEIEEVCSYAYIPGIAPPEAKYFILNANELPKDVLESAVFRQACEQSGCATGHYVQNPSKHQNDQQESTNESTQNISLQPPKLPTNGNPPNSSKTNQPSTNNKADANMETDETVEELRENMEEMCLDSPTPESNEEIWELVI